jgi:cytochrome c oxidase cbb3-type subunit 3
VGVTLLARSIRLMLVMGVASLALPAGLLGQTAATPDSLPPGVTPGMVERGKQIFEGEGLCINCHGPEAGGYLGPNLTDAEWWHAEGSYLAIVRQILVGVPANQSVSGTVMQPRGGSSISDEDVQAVAAYVWRLSHPHAADSLPNAVTPAMLERGDQVFHGPGNCYTCHGDDATGDVGPNLTDEEWLHTKGSYLTILQQVLVGVSAERSRSGVVMPPRGGSNISDADVHAVAAYVWVLGRR